VKVYILTIKRNSERLAFLSQRLRQLGLEYEAIEGIDGAQITDEEAAKIDVSFHYNLYGVKMSKYEVAAALSHRKVYKVMLNEGVRKALILEDDAFPLSCTPEIINALEPLENYDLCLLYHGKAKKTPWYKKLPHNYRLYRYLRPTSRSRRAIMFTVAYVLTDRGASRLLQVSENKMMPPDFLTGSPQRHKLRTYGIEPNCVDHGLFESSTIRLP
jgi:glycosyl transferase, family 25